MTKYCFPALFGTLEGTFERDLTRFGFVFGNGSGNCRIVNSKIAFTSPGAKIYLGHLTNPAILKRSASSFHLWGEYSNGGIIDVACPPDRDPMCRDRTFFAVIDAGTLKIEYNKPEDEKDSDQVTWAASYLPTLKIALRK